jgi:dynein heavy chain
VYKEVEGSVKALMRQNNLFDREKATWFLKII